MSTKTHESLVKTKRIFTWLFLRVVPVLNFGGIYLENMADKAVATASKPQMRGLLNAAIKRNIYVALAISAVSGFAFKHFVGTERKRKYAEFYRNYDGEKEFEEMRKKGLFQSC